MNCKTYALRPNFSPFNPKIFKNRKNISKDFRQIGARYGSYSYIINRSGMKKILDFFKKYKILMKMTILIKSDNLCYVK
ncbi:MAG: hypothetical protein AMS24_03195 [Chlamydiae bacterium SM23_39]|nr:MAG: hypothetical protein AMS24_03195 [Chlamydiae bacterium SM23_39]